MGTPKKDPASWQGAGPTSNEGPSLARGGRLSPPAPVQGRGARAARRRRVPSFPPGPSARPRVTAEPNHGRLRDLGPDENAAAVRHQLRAYPQRQTRVDNQSESLQQCSDAEAHGFGTLEAAACNAQQWLTIRNLEPEQFI